MTMLKSVVAQPERQWRHLDTCQYRTIVHAAPPRSACPKHGARVVKLPWAEPSSRFTALFEALAIAWLQAASQQAVAGLLRLSWDEMHGIIERAVKRGLERRQAEPLTHIGVDEKAFRKGHKYLTLVNDLKRGRVLYVALDRKQSSLDGFWATLTPEQIGAVEAVAMDMWNPYVASVRQHLPGAEDKIVYDKFHIAQHLGGAVDKVRRKENKVLRAAGDDTLVGTRYDWLRHPARMEPKDRRAFAALRDSGLKTARAWALKETMMAFFGLPLREAGPQALSLVVQLGGAEPAASDGGSGADAEAAVSKHRDLSAPPHHQRGQRIAEREDSMGEVHRPRIPEPTELHQRHLLPLRRAEPGSLATRMPEDPHFLL